jgi:molecular chaperone DnaK (HSP70)
MNIGIDLGTTNSALAYIDSTDEADYPTIHVLDVPQYIAQGRIEPRRTLPSFLYLGDQEYTGVYAREQGAIVPTKCVHSAKSWLSNPAVDRTAKILPRPGAVTGGSFHAHYQTSGGCLAEAAGICDRRTQRGVDGPRELRRRSARAHRPGRPRSRH